MAYFSIHDSNYIDVKGSNVDALKLFACRASYRSFLSTTPRDSYAWNWREMATLLTQRKSLAEIDVDHQINVQESYH